MLELVAVLDDALALADVDEVLPSRVVELAVCVADELQVFVAAGGSADDAPSAIGAYLGH